MTFTAQYFIDKFSAIPDEEWCTRQYTDSNGRHCAVGHCVNADERTGLGLLFDGTPIPMINDGEEPRYPQETPRARILAALHDIKAHEDLR